MAPGPEPGTTAGTASWKVEGGEGQFALAGGLLVSMLETLRLKL